LHPKFGAELEVRALPWGFALIPSRLDAQRVPKKTFPQNQASLQLPADERACPMSSIRNLSWPSQWRFQISAQTHLKFELASQSVIIDKAHPKL
jgi:hypothetical protein